MECLFAKMLPLEQKQTERQMSLMRTTWPGKQVWFSWYQGNSCVVCLHNPGEGGADCRHWQARGGLLRTPCFLCSLKVCASSDVHNTRSKSSLWGCCSSAGSPAVLLQGSFQCMEPDGERRTQQGLGTAMYCSAHRSATHTHSLPYSLCLWQSLNSSFLSVSPLLLHALVSVLPFYLGSILCYMSSSKPKNTAENL